MEKQELYSKIFLNFDAVIKKNTEIGVQLRAQIEALHPADIAYFFSLLDKDEARELFLSFDPELQFDVFKEFSDVRKASFSSVFDDKQLRHVLMHLSTDELSGFFDELSDEELKRYLRMMQKKDREKILSLLQSPQDSVSRHMDINVFALIKDFTVERAIQLLQRLQPDQELHRRIFVTSRDGHLEGHILLEDLVLKKPHTRLASIVRKNEFVALADEDRESVAQKMTHYNVMTVPVVDHKGNFLGIIPADALVDILEEESSEDIFRMATLTPTKDSYFETPFLRLFYQRSFILVILLMVQSISSTIQIYFEAVLAGFLAHFIQMLISTGGNASSQASATVIKGLATGELDEQNIHKFIMREFLVALLLGVVLGGIAFCRVYYFFGKYDFVRSFAVSCSLSVIVVISVTLGGCVPLFLKRLNVDPAHSAGPLLTTMMDIIGLLIYCMISSAILR